MRTAELAITALIIKCIVLLEIQNEALFPPIPASKSISASKKIPVGTLSTTNEMETALS
jgi:hypothetical protein